MLFLTHGAPCGARPPGAQRRGKPLHQCHLSAPDAGAHERPLKRSMLHIALSLPHPTPVPQPIMNFLPTEEQRAWPSKASPAFSKTNCAHRYSATSPTSSSKRAHARDFPWCCPTAWAATADLGKKTAAWGSWLTLMLRAARAHLGRRGHFALDPTTRRVFARKSARTTPYAKNTCHAWCAESRVQRHQRAGRGLERGREVTCRAQRDGDHYIVMGEKPGSRTATTPTFAWSSCAPRASSGNLSMILVDHAPSTATKAATSIARHRQHLDRAALFSIRCAYPPKT